MGSEWKGVKLKALLNHLFTAEGRAGNVPKTCRQVAYGS